LSHAYPLLALGRASWRYVPRDEIAAPTGCFLLISVVGKLSTLGSDTFWCFRSEHWTHVDRLFTKPIVPDLIEDPLAGRKRAKLDATQSGFSKRHLLSSSPRIMPLSWFR
jgi:hypothetical protein